MGYREQWRDQGTLEQGASSAKVEEVCVTRRGSCDPTRVDLVQVDDTQVRIPGFHFQWLSCKKQPTKKGPIC